MTTEMQFVSFPSIIQYRNVIREVSDAVRFAGSDAEGKAMFNSNPLPTLTFTATVKLHGTNAAVSMNVDENIGAQSRNTQLTLAADHYGFCAFTNERKETFKKLLKRHFNENTLQVTVFGEHCGGSIQKKVGLNGLPEMFVVFAVYRMDRFGGGEWLSPDLWRDLHANDINVYNIYQFPTWEVEIDFNKPELARNALVDLTLSVERECPVAAALGAGGIGEGLVLTHTSELGRFVFKSKGEKHSPTKTKTLAPVDVEKVNSVREFVASVVTDARLEQGLEFLAEQHLEPEVTNLGVFIQWVQCDVFKEESDVIAENALDRRMIACEVAKLARAWYFKLPVTA